MLKGYVLYNAHYKTFRKEKKKKKKNPLETAKRSVVAKDSSVGRDQ